MTPPTAKHTAAIKRSIGRILGLLFFLLLVDGFVYRDPYIKLSHGYGIGSISNSTPCSLEYGGGDGDARSGERWWAGVGSLGDRRIYWLSKRDSDEFLQFDNEQDWLAAIKKHHVKPSDDWLPRIENVTQFNSRESIIFGDCEGGYFIADTASNDVGVVANETAWRSEVERLTGAPPGWMWSANSFLLKYRNPEYLAFMGILTLVCLVVVYRRRNIPIGQRSP
ncbi:MAG: hypothetical protein H6819_00550 [Phycisphaerales bacterium]|nr:hypothetical protein [Phycisphaerales bacterium]MCB9857303.1 hypothetical protein [Phycisphaerales bacterium]MCB9862983.1 hypothetical protein [Phycisphaerales bacterium]